MVAFSLSDIDRGKKNIKRKLICTRKNTYIIKLRTSQTMNIILQPTRFWRIFERPVGYSYTYPPPE